MEAKHLSSSQPASQPAKQAPINSLAQSIINMLEEQPAVVKVTDDSTLSLMKPPSCLFPSRGGGCAQTDTRVLFIYTREFVRLKRAFVINHLSMSQMRAQEDT